MPTYTNNILCHEYALRVCSLGCSYDQHHREGTCGRGVLCEEPIPRLLRGKQRVRCHVESDQPEEQQQQVLSHADTQEECQRWR